MGVYDKRWGKVGRVPAASAARILDYYLIPGDSTEGRLAVEVAFAELENLVAPLIVALDKAPVGGVELSTTDRHNLASYIAVLHVRGPAYRDGALQRARELSTDLDGLGLADPDVFRIASRRLGVTGTNDELEARRQLAILGFATGRISIRVPPAVSLGGLTPAVNKGVPLLLGREWELLRNERWPGFIIGDQPVALLSRGQIAPSIGFASPDVQVFMPLSPRTLLLISSRPWPPFPLSVRAEPRTGLVEPWWALCNKVAWATSQRYVWGRKDDLQATALLLPQEMRRRDFRILDDEQEARRQAVLRERRDARRRADREIDAASGDVV